MWLWWLDCAILGEALYAGVFWYLPETPPKLVQQVSFIYRFFDSFSSLYVEIMYVMCVRFVFWCWGNLMNFVALKGHEDILFKLRNKTPFV